MKKLFENLKKLTEGDTTPFYSSIQTVGNGYFEIFNYHYTNKDSWLIPDALEARGIMFEITRKGEYIRLASRPMHKFFNKGENDLIEYSDPVLVMNKADGSLISSYVDSNGLLCLKSKGSITSDYANLAMEILNNDATLKDFVAANELAGRTVNMELVSPDPKFRIVLHYKEAKLIVLNCRHRLTGHYLEYVHIPKKYFAGTVDTSVLDHLDSAKNIEGYVVIDDKDNWWKEKTAWYLERHRAKDFINQPNAFIALVLKDEADDVFALLVDQPEILKEMQELQHKVISKANTIVNSVTSYWNKNKELSRKDYAIKGKDTLHPLEFPLAMQFYTAGDEPDWNNFLLKQVKKIDWKV